MDARSATLVGIAVWLGCLGGCGRRSTAVQPASAPATQTSGERPASAPATQVAASRPTTRAVMSIGGVAHEFPRARLRITRTEAGVVARLFSEEAKSGGPWARNSFYLEMPLMAGETDDIESATWRFSTPDTQRADSPNGIFLDGGARELQPKDVTVDFRTSGEQVVVHVEGQFLVFDGDADGDAEEHESGGEKGVAPAVQVKADLTVQAERK